MKSAYISEDCTFCGSGDLMDPDQLIPDIDGRWRHMMRAI
jgi:hypothetical protein